MGLLLLALLEAATKKKKKKIFRMSTQLRNYLQITTRSPFPMPSAVFYVLHLGSFDTLSTKFCADGNITCQPEHADIPCQNRC